MSNMHLLIAIWGVSCLGIVKQDETDTFRAAWARVWGDQLEVSEVAASWFEGYVAGKTGNGPPSWWILSLRSARRLESGKLFYLIPSQLDNYPVVEVINERESSLSDGKTKVILPKWLIETIMKSAERRGGADRITMQKLDEAEKAIVCVYSDSGFECSLYCIDLKTNSLEWESKVADRTDGISIGLSFSKLSISFSDNAVFLWGVEPNTLFFQVVDLESGDVVSSFRGNAVAALKITPSK